MPDVASALLGEPSHLVSTLVLVATVEHWLNAREQAVVIWAALFAGWALIAVPSLRTSLLTVARMAVSRPLGPVLALAVAYTTGVALALYHLGALYDTAPKDVTIWYFGVAIPLLATAATKPVPMGSAIRRAFSLATVLTFIVGVYVFPLLVELLLVPAVGVVVLTQAVASLEPGQRQVADLLAGVLTCFGLGLLVYVVIEAVGDPRRLIAVPTWEQFALPIILTLTFLPFACGVHWYNRWSTRRAMRQFRASTAHQH